MERSEGKSERIAKRLVATYKKESIYNKILSAIVGEDATRQEFLNSQDDFKKRALLKANGVMDEFGKEISKMSVVCKNSTLLNMNIVCDLLWSGVYNGNGPLTIGENGGMVVDEVKSMQFKDSLIEYNYLASRKVVLEDAKALKDKVWHCAISVDGFIEGVNAMREKAKSQKAEGAR